MSLTKVHQLQVSIQSNHTGIRKRVIKFLFVDGTICQYTPVFLPDPLVGVSPIQILEYTQPIETQQNSTYTPSNFGFTPPPHETKSWQNHQMYLFMIPLKKNIDGKHIAYGEWKGLFSPSRSYSFTKIRMQEIFVSSIETDQHIHGRF